MANVLDPWVVPDPMAALQYEPRGLLIAQPMPERGGTLRSGVDYGREETAIGAGPYGYAPPDDGTEGVKDRLLCQ